jgi:quinol-cytochrome oxidoreductase complex cytochrome b subunit
MTCKNCGTEIAERAIVCYRCGQPTTAARLAPAALPSRSRSIVVTLAFVILMLAALFLGQAGTHTVPPEVSWTVTALAAIVLVWRVAIRRR